MTDANTRPIEFRLTDPVHTDEVQRVLYGATYDDALYYTCLAAPLLEAIRESPDVLLVRDQELLGMQDVPLPLLWIGRDPDGDEGDFVVGSRSHDEAIQATRAKLGEAVRGRDLLEPFDRISEALERVADDAQRARA